MELKSLNHFFTKRIYKIPEYQRGYSWEKKQIHELLTDIKHANQLDSYHYTGTITIHAQKTTEKIGITSYDIYDIVDGQQRFTTIILILSYLINKLTSSENISTDLLGELREKETAYIRNKGSYLFRYEIDKISEIYYRSLILEHENLSSLDENLYTRNLKEAKEVIINYFKMEANHNKELDYLVALEDKLLFNEYIVKSTSEIGVVFETMNNRGVGLSNLEIVKNRLLYLTSKVKIQDDESTSKNLINTINEKWAVILRNLTLPNKVLNEDSFLNNHWIIYNGWVKDNQTREDILDKQFTIENMVKDQELMLAKIKEYVESLAVTSLHWRFINYPSEDRAFVEVNDQQVRNALKHSFEKLNRINNSTIRPLLLAFMGLMKSDPNELFELAKLMEIFSFRLFSMNKKRSDTGKNDIYRECHGWYLSSNKNEAIARAKYLISWYIDIHGDQDRFKLEVQEMFNSNKKEGYYSWSGLTYFLYEYEEYLRKNQDSKVEFSFANQRSKSIEHIIPQNYKKYWSQELAGLTKKEIKVHIHSLGNLVLIKSEKNSALKDSDFKVKVKAYKIGSYSENEIAQRDKQWTINKIKKREKKLLKFFEERWSLKESFLDKYPYPGYEEVLITDIESEEELVTP